MAIENEKKYVLGISAPAKFMRELKVMEGATAFNIEQAYLDTRTRLRKKENQQTGDVSFFFTFKQITKQGLVEIETPISELDWKLLQAECKKFLRKTRICVPIKDRVWEVDFLISDTVDQPYLIMAEVEMNPGETDPGVIPEFIAENLIYEVERKDRRFDNVNLCSPLSVLVMVEKIKNGKL